MSSPHVVLTGPTAVGVHGEATVPDRLEVRLPSGSKVLICSDLHLGSSATDESSQVTAEIAEWISGWSGPGAIVLNGDCFELSSAGRPPVGAILDAHPQFEQALAGYRYEDVRRVVVTIGNHDARIAWDDEARACLEGRLGATVALVCDVLLDTDRGVHVVRVEHGHRFDPASALPHPGDPPDTPLAPQLVEEVRPAVTGRALVADASSLSDPTQFPQFLGSRLVYRVLLPRAWWLALPFLAALIIRTPLLARGLSRARSGLEVSRWLIIAGAGLVVGVGASALVALLIARSIFRALAVTRLGPTGTRRNEPARAAAEALGAEGFAGFVTGHTHHPELAPLPTGFYANSGCGLAVVESRRARLGLPPVFCRVFRRSWVELESGRTLATRLVVAETPAIGSTRVERLASAGRPGRPSTPTVVASVPGGAGWPISHQALEAAAHRERRRRIAAGVVLTTAFIGTLSAVTPPLRGRLRLLLEVLPVELPQAASAALVFVSFTLGLVASGLRRGNRLAWLTALGVLGVSVVLNLVKGGDIEEAALDLVIGGWLVAYHADFPVRPDTGAVRRSLVLGATAAVTAVAASFGLVAAVGAHRRADVDTSLRALAERLGGQRTAPLPAYTPFVVPALTATVVAIGIVVVWLLLRPRRPRRLTQLEHEGDRARAQRVLERCGGDTLSYFALRDDKDWFFTGSSVVAYSVRNGVCLVSPDPIGPVHEWADAWAEFSSFADRHGWSVAIVGAQPGWLPVYEASGMQSIYMGDEAIVDCQSFTLHGRATKSLRGNYNRVKKAGYRVVFLDPSQLDPGLAVELRQMMSQTRRGGTERGFSMTLSRAFDPIDTGLLLSVALDAEGRAAAFCQWVPAADIDGWSLDLMRRRADPDLTNGVTDFVIIETIEYVRAAHQWGLGLNFAVMRAVVAGEREGAFYDLGRRVLHRISETTQIESLWRFNEKYQPYWRPRYVVVDAVERAASAGIAIADAEAIWELPVVGRFLGRRR